MVHGRRRGRLWVVALATGLAVGAACGDADEAVAPEGDTTTTAGGDATTSTSGADDSSTTSTSAAATVDVAVFCDAYLQGEQLFVAGPEVDDAGMPTPEGLERFASQLQPFLDQLAAEAPEEVQSEVTEVLDAVGQALETGDPGPTQTAEFVQAESRIEGFLYDNCELDEQAGITAVEYEFQDVPAELPAGRVGFQLQNDGEEVHELVVFRFAPDEQRSVQELLELPEEEAFANVEFVTATVAGPGSAGYTLTDLDAGRYAAVCFVPVGTTSLEAFAEMAPGEGQDAPPHAAQGMVTEFTVS